MSVTTNMVRCVTARWRLVAIVALLGAVGYLTMQHMQEQQRLLAENPLLRAEAALRSHDHDHSHDHSHDHGHGHGEHHHEAPRAAPQEPAPTAAAPAAGHNDHKQMAGKEERKPEDELVMFVSECHHFHDAQTLAQQYSNERNGNGPGLPRSRVLRINNCGCDIEKIFGKKTLPRYSVPYKTADFGLEFVTPCNLVDPGTENKVYWPGTKPFSVNYLFQHDPPVEETIILTDPDFIILRPFGERVKPGTIVAHFYPFGIKFGEHPVLAPAVCPECHKLSTRELWNYCIGPPYVMHRDDWIRLAPLWFELTNQIRSNATLREIGGFYTDMVTFSQAVIKLGIKVDLRKDLMISLPNEEVARKDFDADKGVWRKLPYSHHYCQSYDLQMPGRHIYKHTHLHDVNFTNCDGGLEEAKKLAPGCQKDFNGEVDFYKSKNVDLAKAWLCHNLARNMVKAVEWYHAAACSK